MKSKDNDGKTQLAFAYPYESYYTCFLQNLLLFSAGLSIWGDITLAFTNFLE